MKLRRTKEHPNEVCLEASPMMRAMLGHLGDNPDLLVDLMKYGAVRALNQLRQDVNHAELEVQRLMVEGVDEAEAIEKAMATLTPLRDPSETPMPTGPKFHQAHDRRMGQLLRAIESAPPTYLTETM